MNEQEKRNMTGDQGRDLGQARSRLAEDLDALDSRSAPEWSEPSTYATSRGIYESAPSERYEWTPRTSSRAMSALRGNPLPMALMGVGVGWLLWDASKRYRSSRNDFGYARGLDYDYDYPYGRGYDYRLGEGDQGTGLRERARHMAEDTRDRARHVAEDTQWRARHLASEARERVHDLGERAREGAESVRENVRGAAVQVRDSAREAAMQVRDRARGTAMQVRDRAEHYGEMAREQAMRARAEARHVMEENPLLVGAIAVAAGIGVGMMLPSTPPERRYMGEARDRFVDRVRERVEDTAQQAKEIATETARRAGEKVSEVVRTEAEQRHLIPEPGQAAEQQKPTESKGSKGKGARA